MRNIDRLFNEIEKIKEKEIETNILQDPDTYPKILVNKLSGLDFWKISFRLKVLYRYIEYLNSIWGAYTAERLFDEVEKETIDEKEKIKDDIEELIQQEMIILK